MARYSAGDTGALEVVDDARRAYRRREIPLPARDLAAREPRGEAALRAVPRPGLAGPLDT